MSDRDSDLLTTYAREGDHAAFATLVARHLDLVYSVARRQTGSSGQAEQVAQMVFIQLARESRTIKGGTPLVAWLHAAARRRALHAVGDGARRRARGQEAVAEPAAAIVSAKAGHSPVWPMVEPLLDEAVETLGELDRAAILLRFFENHPPRELGAALGISEQGAQQRASHALDQLCGLFLRRGIVVSAPGLATDLSAHAVIGAPAHIGPAIASLAAVAGTARAPGPGALTTTQRRCLTAAFALLLGAGVYEGVLLFRQSTRLASLQQQVDFLTNQSETIRRQVLSVDAHRRGLEGEIQARMAASAEAANTLEAQARHQLAKVDALKRLAAANPQLCVPEMALVSEDEWFDIAQDPDSDPRRLLARLRWHAGRHLAPRIGTALAEYLKRHEQVMPTDVSQLLPFFDPPIEAAWLERYAINRPIALKPADHTQNVEGLISLRTVPIDLELDEVWSIGIDYARPFSAAEYNFVMAQRALLRANPTKTTATAAELLPYLKWPMPEDLLARQMPATGVVQLR